MKKLYPTLIISLLFLFIGCSTFEKEYDEDAIVYREHIYYRKYSDEIVNGRVYKMMGSVKVHLGKMKNGKRKGLWTDWNENGVKSFEGKFIDGELDGVASFFDEVGFNYKTINYKNGLKNGLSSFFDEVGSDSKTISKTINYKDGLKNGESITYSLLQLIQSGIYQYKNDLLNGPSRIVNDSLKQIEKGSYKNDKRDGLWKNFYFPKFKFADVRIIEDSLIRKSEGVYRDNKKIGKWIYYNEDGSVKN